MEEVRSSLGRENFEIPPYQVGTKSILPHERTGFLQAKKGILKESMDKVIFLDRDGTINEEVNYLYRTEDLRIFPEVFEAIRLFNQNGYRVVVVTNQAGVARGYYKEEDVEKLHAYLNWQLKQQNAHIDHFFYCPHHPDYGVMEYKKLCSCRKPEIGMFLMAEQFYQIDKNQSFMIGDKNIDMQAGRNYGVSCILTATGYGSEIHQKVLMGQEKEQYDFYAENLMDAARYIIG